VSSDRERFLEIAVRAAQPGSGHGPVLPEPVPVAAAGDLVAQFTEALLEVSGEVIRARDAAEAARRLVAGVAPDGRPWYVAERELAAALGAHLAAERADIAHMADCQAAITEAEWAIADTGTVCLLLDARQPRSCYLLPEVHVAVCRLTALLPTLDEALLRLGGRGGLPTACVFVTGPSRTADIEKTIVIPAHGPKRLIAVLLDEAR
jgi:L-lactate dehydrogenase complex protein LldG